MVQLVQLVQAIDQRGAGHGPDQGDDPAVVVAVLRTPPHGALHAEGYEQSKDLQGLGEDAGVAKHADFALWGARNIIYNRKCGSMTSGSLRAVSGVSLQCWLHGAAVLIRPWAMASRKIR